jgi:hypothetical protein
MMTILKIELATMGINTLSSLMAALYDHDFILAANWLDRKITDIIRWADQVILADSEE